jgi:tRNA modification GTPase
MNDLMNQVSLYSQSFFSSGETALITRERHRKALEDVSKALERACNEGNVGREDVIAEELRLANRVLGRLTGRVDVEDILNVIFRDFCIGK